MITQTILRLSVAMLLGGLVGYEREHKNRPAGLRTHILVCIGSALVQIISFNYTNLYGPTAIDPMRLGAQVISGIGFLGAGTILKEGVNVKGLTTAASLWTVACIGLAIGSGFTIEATIATIFVFIALKGFKFLEQKISKEYKYYNLQVVVRNIPGVMGSIGKKLGEKGINIVGVEISGGEDEEAIIYLNLKASNESTSQEIFEMLMKITEIKEIKII
ncbi:putative Mg(2+) transport ATPase [Caloramator mitchellensis]|uniref:Putative Mg(2+) transport ATPase n=1 Tax=Caloramator mitchellensis TaxID=908809 RepID=A0A0R3K3A0_CALMK|nr:MgtC/SapB family protein [Caloramator mitchellensis]KRQ87410.1 putative Mg(2+) transport ATPase [Caloramator mitchellensis]